MKNENIKGAGKPAPTKRQARYGKLVRGWDWRTIPERLQKAERLRLAQGITRTELLERAIDEYIAKHEA
jgi:hypothetical protein